MEEKETKEILQKLEYAERLLQEVEEVSINKGKFYVWKLCDSIEALQKAINDYRRRIYTKPKRITYKKEVYVPYSVYKGLIEHSPTAYLDNFIGIESVQQEFEDGCSVSISPSPTLELEDDFSYCLYDCNGNPINKTYYESFVDYWHIVNQNTNEEYILHTIVEKNN